MCADTAPPVNASSTTTFGAHFTPQRSSVELRIAHNAEFAPQQVLAPTQLIPGQLLASMQISLADTWRAKPHFL